MKFRALPTLLFAAAFSSALPLSLSAATSSSTSYTITADSLDSGGTQTASATYTNQGSAGTIGAIATVTSPAETIKSGFTGQLYEITGLELAPTFTADGTAQPLAAAQTLDDGTLLALTGDDESWSVVAGQLPAGLMLNPSTGVITGTPTGSGSYTFTIMVTDALGNSVQQVFSGVVSLASDTPAMPLGAVLVLALLLYALGTRFLPKPAPIRS